MPLSPYDNLFKSIFSVPSQAMAFLEKFLPPDISGGLDFRTLDRDPDSYVDEQLKSHFTDMVYSCRWKGSRGSITVSFLLEHKSFVPKNIHLQLLRYLCNIYEKQLEKSGRLNLVIPIVIYHGRKQWQMRSFSDYLPLPLPGMARYLPEFDYEFLHLGNMEDDEIARIRAYPLRHAIFLLKYSGRYKMYFDLVSQKVIIFTQEGVTEEEKVTTNRLTIKFLYMTAKEDFSALIEEMKAGLADVEPLEGSIADILLKQGREEGRKQGREIGKLVFRFEDKLDILQKLLEKGPEADFIAFVSGLSLSFVQSFARVYEIQKVPLLLEAAASARRSPDRVAAAAEIRRGLLSFGLAEREVEDYFEVVHGGD